MERALKGRKEEMNDCYRWLEARTTSLEDISTVFGALLGSRLIILSASLAALVPKPLLS